MRLQTLMLISVTNGTHGIDAKRPHRFHALIVEAIKHRDLAEAAAVLTRHPEDAQERALHTRGTTVMTHAELMNA